MDEQTINPNLSVSDYEELVKARKWAWIARKFIRTKRYRRHEARILPAAVPYRGTP